jgi:phage terminase large subunit GpA-like protein
VYPPSHGHPGPRDPSFTPYIVPFLRFADDPKYETCVLITGTQSSKTDGILDIMGWRLATRPRPMIYIGPSRDFVADIFEPRLMKLLDEAPVLADLVARGKRNKKMRKVVNGVAVRLALGNSPASLAGDSVGDIFIDEFDKMAGGMKGEGDVLTLAKARAHTYADRKIVITSTPKRGAVAMERDAKTGMEFWALADARDIESPIWSKFQEGTRHHWSWQCPHCASWFVPRMGLLRYPNGATPTQARASTWLECPTSGCVIDEAEKEAMNAAGRYIAPGMTIDNGRVTDDGLVDNTTLSLWVSGLASPFVTWGERSELIIKAEQSGDSEERQGAANDVGELWSPVSGEVLDWQAIANKRDTYPAETMPDGAMYLTVGCDVQKDRLIYVVRAWGARATSWLVEQGELLGDTAQTPVWGDLAHKLTTPIDGSFIKLAFIDSGFRPGKKTAIPMNRVYQFCRRFRHFVFPTKGSSNPMIKPLIKSRPDVTRQGDINKYGLELIRLDTDYWKSFVHERLSYPADQLGAWHINADATDDYCKQLVAEARTVTDAGKVVWIERSRHNHFLDCEAMSAAAGFMLNVHHIRPGTRRLTPTEPDAPTEAAFAAVKPRTKFADLAARINT